MAHPPTDDHSHPPFSPSLFALTLFLTLAGLFAGMRWLAPELWHAEWSASWWRVGVVFVAVSLVTCFFEYFFHRYVLHTPAVPGLSWLYRQHTLHHSLTRIVRRTARDGSGILHIENKFPIVEEEQHEAAFFPWYSLAIFALILTPLFLGLHLLAPAFPWFVVGYLTLATSLTLYEVLHALNHWPLERWEPLLVNPRWNWFWQPVYGFHLRHHAVIDCNESISGFLGLPVADWLLGTCVIPKTVYADGEEWSAEKFVSPRPVAPIRWLDRWAQGVVKARRAGGVGPARPRAGAGEEPHPYSRDEELANWLTHAIGSVLSAFALVLLVVFASQRGETWHVVSFSIFGLTLLLLYTFSTLYHTRQSEGGRRLFRRLDHAAIFLLIAGTYTPFLLTDLRGPWGWALFGVIWSICIAGAVLKVVYGDRFRRHSTLAYIVSGWLILVAIKPMIAAFPAGALWLLLAGGVLYTAGVGFYVWRRLRFHHAVWHLFVMGGSTCHFLAVFLFLLPQRA